MDKRIITLGMIVGSFLGSYTPMLWGDDGLSFSSVLFGGIGAFIGVWLAFKFTR